MSKYFNSHIIAELELRHHQRLKHPQRTLPDGEIHLLFVSTDPNYIVSRKVIKKTVEKISYDANLGNESSVRIDGGSYDPTDSDRKTQSDDSTENSVHIQPSIKPNQGSGDNAEKQITTRTMKLQTVLQKLNMVELSSLSEPLDSQSESDMEDSSETCKMIAQYEDYYGRQEIYASLTSIMSPAKIMLRLRNAARSYVKQCFGRDTPLEWRDEAVLSPTLFGPSLDEPLLTLLDHIYHTICWLCEPEIPDPNRWQRNCPI